MTQLCYLNGEFMPLDQAKVSVLDRGFIFGDGVYEVIPAYDRRAFWLPEHLARLQASLDGIKLRNPLSAAQWSALVERIIEQNSGQDQAIYLQVTRGVAKREFGFPKDATPTVFMMSSVFSAPPAEQIEAGVPAVMLPDSRWLRCHIKSVALLGAVLLRQEAIDRGGSECVLMRDGYLTEGSSSNIFVVKNGVLMVPPKSHLILSGITYDVVLHLAREQNIAVQVREVTQDEVERADELFLSATTREITPITKLNDKPVGSGKPGAVFQRLWQAFQSYKRSAAAYDRQPQHR